MPGRGGALHRRIAGGDPRIQFIEHGDLDSLLDACAGVVTVNSTVGGLALAKGKPVHALGRVLYVIAGLSDPGPLARFWQAPQPPEPGAHDLFARALWSECLLNAGFHSREGLARLAPLMEANPDAVPVPTAFVAATLNL